MTKKYWWVNQTKTFYHENIGWYMWSPQKDKNWKTNIWYENMRKVQPGDYIISYKRPFIMAIWIAWSIATESGFHEGWGYKNDTGWQVPVHWTLLDNPLHVDILKIQPTLYNESIYSPTPFDKNKNIKQGYLFQISEALFNKLRIEFLQKENNTPVDKLDQTQDLFDILSNSDISETECETLYMARVGQWKFREKLIRKYKWCAVTWIKELGIVIASHIKPWKLSNNYERMDVDNGLLLSPNFDKLFDRCLISFSDEGKIVIFHKDTEIILNWLWISILNDELIMGPNKKQKEYLKKHRELCEKKHNSMGIYHGQP